MPTVFRHGGYRFYFFSDEGDPREPVHVHVRRGGDEAKFWLYPAVEVTESFGFNAMELNFLRSLIERNRSLIESAWNGHFGHSSPLR